MNNEEIYEEEHYTLGKGLYKLACVIGGLGALLISIWLWQHDFHSWWVVALGVLGAIEAL